MYMGTCNFAFQIPLWCHSIQSTEHDWQSHTEKSVAKKDLFPM